MNKLTKSLKKYWKKLKKNKYSKYAGFAILLFLILFPLFAPTGQKSVPPKEVEYPAFLKMVEAKQVENLTIDLKAATFTFVGTDEINYKTDNPKLDTFKDEMLRQGIAVKELDSSKANSKTDTVVRLINMAVYIIIFLFLFRMLNKQLGSKSKDFEFKPEENEKEDDSDKTKIGQVSTSNGKITFAHIAGHDEAKEDMLYLVDFLKNPERYSEMGAKLPKGVIFYGPPGTGKTLFARAIAGEANVSFFNANGSDFVEMYVGVGAKRVRQLFEAARKKAPCIIFIDEIDQLGGSRDKDTHQEQRQTLNAILSEMDGFEANKGIIVIGATNRMNDLDSAFIRPGRFDKRIAIELPDQNSRHEILKLHAKNKPLAESVNLEELAKMTIGFSGAFLESILNEAAIIATTRSQKEITPVDIDDAYYKVVMEGHKKKGGDKRDNEELKLIAWHEAGHALAAKLLTTLEVPKVTIVPSTSGAGGVAFILPKKMGLYTKEEMLNDIKISYAGRAAEFLLRGDESKVTTGASSDIQNATSKIRQMITHMGMSDNYGMINLDVFQGGRHAALADEVVDEASRMAKRLYQETIDLLQENKRMLDSLATALLEKETLVEEEIDNIIRTHQWAA